MHSSFIYLFFAQRNCKQNDDDDDATRTTIGKGYAKIVVASVCVRNVKNDDDGDSDSATRPYAAANEKRMKNAYESDSTKPESTSDAEESGRCTTDRQLLLAVNRTAVVCSALLGALSLLNETCLSRGEQQQQQAQVRKGVRGRARSQSKRAR